MSRRSNPAIVVECPRCKEIALKEWYYHKFIRHSYWKCDNCDFKTEPTVGHNWIPKEPEEMELYIGTKIIKAKAMIARDAKTVLSREICIDNAEPKIAPNDPPMRGMDVIYPGYLVEYPDGYRSWSPKKQFEEAYKLAESFQDRLFIELEELQAKVAKLRDFLADPEKPLLKDGELPRLQEQLQVMERYAFILNERIAASME
jgi:hypothetical protein